MGSRNWRGLGRRLRRRWARWRAETLFRRARTREDLVRAEAAFRRLETLDPGSFSVELHLGALAIYRGDREAGFARLGRLRRRDPARFAAADLPTALKAEVAARAARPLPARGPERAVRAPSPRAAQRRRDDFSGPEEEARFRGREAISRRELEAADIEDLLARLTRN
ncbi:MAG: hypothetical protein R3F20_00640 [Planctomycetota bacterium]